MEAKFLCQRRKLHAWKGGGKNKPCSAGVTGNTYVNSWVLMQMHAEIGMGVRLQTHMQTPIS